MNEGDQLVYTKLKEIVMHGTMQTVGRSGLPHPTPESSIEEIRAFLLAEYGAAGVSVAGIYDVFLDMYPDDNAPYLTYCRTLDHMSEFHGKRLPRRNKIRRLLRKDRERGGVTQAYLDTQKADDDAS